MRIDDDLDPVLVLISRDPRRYSSVLLDLLGQRLDDTQWVAVNSMLWTHPTREYATRLLREWKHRIQINVIDCAGCAEDAGAGYGKARKPARNQSGFPPIWHYAVYDGVRTPGATAIADGPHPVSFVRQKDARMGGGLVPRDDYRKDYLQELAQVRLPDSSVTLLWKDASKYRADAVDLIFLFQKSETELQRILIAKGLLERSDLPIGQEPESTVVDRRLDQASPLPTIHWPNR